MELKPYRHDDLRLMPPRECERDIVEREERETGELRASGPAFTLWDDDGTPLGAAGVIVFRKGVGEAWLRGTPRMYAHRVAAARRVKEGLAAVMRELKLHRVQLTVRCGHRGAERFARWLGFEYEGVLRQAGENRESYLMMAMVNGTAEVR